MDKQIIYVSEEIDTKYKARTETFICLTQKYKNDKNSLQEVFDTLEKSRKTQKQSDALSFS